MDQVAHAYPGTAAGGADYFTGAAQRPIEQPDGTYSLERVLVTDKNVDYEGDVCISETTIRHWGHLFGLYDGTQVTRLQSHVDQVEAERNELSRQLASALRQIEVFELERDPIRTIYVAGDNTEHASERAAHPAGKRRAPSPLPAGDQP